MPTINLAVDITSAQASRLQTWFPVWNAGLAVPFATFNDALIGILKHQIASFVQTSGPENVKEAWAAAPQSTKDQVLALLNLD